LEWSFKTQDQIKSSSCVLAAKHLVICGSYDHTLYGLEASTGICQWRVNLQGSIFAKPLYIEQNNTLYAATTKGTVSALSLFGKKITPTFTWTVEVIIILRSYYSLFIDSNLNCSYQVLSFLVQLLLKSIKH
jgi:outer membrane protein assembly factor BamB